MPENAKMMMPAVLSIGVVQSVTGLFVGLLSGSEIIAAEFEPPILTVYPRIPDEMYFTDPMDVGDRLTVRARNPTGGAITLRTVAQMSPF